MYFRTFFFLFFVMSSALFFLSSLNPNLTLDLCSFMCENKLSLNFIQLTSMIASSITLILFMVSSHYAQKRILLEKERIASDRLNIASIHAELEALKE